MPTLDAAEAPLILVTYPAVASIESVNALFAGFRRIAAEHGRVGWVVDMREFNPLSAPAPIRKAFADEYERCRRIIESATVCEARIFTSPMVRGIVTAVDWLLNRKYPMKTFAELEPAKAWVRGQLAGPR
jgi:hypothetical protein